MNTTMLVVELLIAGTQVSVWLVMLVFALFGFDWLRLDLLGGWTGLVVVVFLAFAYPLGVAIDRLADALYESWNRKLVKRALGSQVASVAALRFEFGKENASLDRALEYARTRVRIMRATSLNMAVSTLVGVALVLARFPELATRTKAGLCLAILVAGTAIVVACVLAWRSLTVGYLGLVKALRGGSQPKGTADPEIPPAAKL